jgi:hypothetical protein
VGLNNTCGGSMKMLKDYIETLKWIVHQLKEITNYQGDDPFFCDTVALIDEIQEELQKIIVGAER